jgi:hypothetical protein
LCLFPLILDKTISGIFTFVNHINVYKQKDRKLNRPVVDVARASSNRHALQIRPYENVTELKYEDGSKMEVIFKVKSTYNFG